MKDMPGSYADNRFSAITIFLAAVDRADLSVVGYGMGQVKAEVALVSPFVENVNWRQMRVSETGGRYRFVTLTDTAYEYSKEITDGRIISFRDRHDHEWMQMTRHTQIIRKGYAWNGNTPKTGVNLCGRDLWYGTPDFLPGHWVGTSLPSSLKHDIDFQCHLTEHFPFSLVDVNRHYRVIAEQHGFRLRQVYGAALGAFSAGIWDRPNPDYTQMRSVIR